MKRFFFLAALMAVLFLPDIADAGLFRGRRGGGCASGDCSISSRRGERRPIFQGRFLFRARCR